MKQITTCYKNNNAVQSSGEIKLDYDDQTQELKIINIYPSYKKQQFAGFGGAFTEAAGYVFAKLPENEKEQLLEAYFSSDGLGYVFGRCAIDSCDFALGNYSAVNSGKDKDLSTFTLARDKQYILPFLHAARRYQPNLKIMLSPWSPPAFMKTNGQKNDGGRLRSEYAPLWAEYLCRYIKEYQNEGIDVFALSVQNEPNVVQTWDSCQYTAKEEQDFIVRFLGDKLAFHGLSDILLTIWDHNKEKIYDRAVTVLSDKRADKAVGAIGYHWYSGDHFDALDMVRTDFPDKKLIFTEGCIEYSRFDAENQLAHAQMYAHEIIGSLNHGMNIFLDWNLCLDHCGGPNHAGNFCASPVMTGPDGSTLVFTLSYSYIGHFSRYIKPGAVCVGNSRYGDGIEATACLNEDGSIIVVMMNASVETENCYLRLPDKIAKVTLPQKSISTFIIGANEW